MLTVTGYDEELVILGDIVRADIWKGSNNLLLRWQIGAFLEFKISYSPRKGKVAIDATEINKTSCLTYPCFFRYC